MAEFGRPRPLPRSGGFLLERPIAGLTYRDAMGCYPLFACAGWEHLEADLDEARDDLVCVSLVADPFGEYRPEHLQRCFRDVCVPFKDHFVTDLERPPRTFVSSHHRYYARRALANLSVERCDEPLRFLDDWMDVYACLVERHGLRGVRAFSRLAFAGQLTVPGIVMLRAIHEGRTVAAHLWYVQGEVAYSHLAASSDRGYELQAPYALHWFALETFASNARWLDLGAGVRLRAADGLTWFKKGWATGTRPAYFCGRILDRRRYDEVLAARGLKDGDYFPAYREGELG
jgi:hypothetical protein